MNTEALVTRIVKLNTEIAALTAARDNLKRGAVRSLPTRRQDHGRRHVRVVHSATLS